MTVAEQIKAASKAGVPIVAVESPDPSATIREIEKALNGKKAYLEWDSVRALRGRNEDGESIVATICEGNDPRIATGNPTEALLGCMKFGQDEIDKQKDAMQSLVVFMHMANRLLTSQDFTVVQALWLLRDVFKRMRSMVVLLGPMITLPDELKQDVVVLTEELPDAKQIQEIVERTTKDATKAGAKFELSEKQIVDVVDTLSGLHAFGTEQTYAMCIRKDGVDMDALWERKRKAVEQTEGLAIWRGKDRFDDLGGCDNIKRFMRLVMEGKSGFAAIGWMDEIEKMLAGSTSDTSGTSQDQLGVILREMQDNNIPGILLLGHPGTAKSAITKATGGEFTRPVVQFDFGAMKGSLVGESERKIRAAMRVFRAISNGKGLIIATCNKIDSLPPELRRRFKLGLWFFDLPTAQEREKIWPIHQKRFGLDPDELKSFDDDGWTGAEIAACCEVSWRTGLNLRDSSKFIVPICRSAADQIETLRTLAHKRFISAGADGVYTKPTRSQVGSSRAMEV